MIVYCIYQLLRSPNIKNKSIISKLSVQHTIDFMIRILNVVIVDAVMHTLIKYYFAS